MATHKPPARLRYEQSHPTVSCRIDRDTHALLKQRLEDLGGISFADFVKDALGLLQLKMPDIKEIRRTAWSKAHDQAKNDYEIWAFCSVCRKPIYIIPNSEMHKAIIGYVDEHKWHHGNCV